ncbi:MAG: hypothetical protein ACREUE_11450 [Panacagrimonas sp.]
MERPSLIATDCGGAPASRATVYSRTLQRACEVLGGVQPLAAHLRVPADDLARWIDAQGEPPLEVFLAAVDVVLLHAERSRGSA